MPHTEVIHHDCYDVRSGAELGAEQPSHKHGDEDQSDYHTANCHLLRLDYYLTCPSRARR